MLRCSRRNRVRTAYAIASNDEIALRHSVDFDVTVIAPTQNCEEMSSHYMSICGAYIKLSVALMLTSIGLFTCSASGQSLARRPNTKDKEIAAANASQLGNPLDKVANSAPKPDGEDNKDVAK